MLFFLVEVVYDVIPVFYEDIEDSLVLVFGDAARAGEVPEMLHFGSWVGGDMDGLPDVHAKTIRESCARHHALIVNRYFLEAQAPRREAEPERAAHAGHPAAAARPHRALQVGRAGRARERARRATTRCRTACCSARSPNGCAPPTTTARASTSASSS